MLMTNLSLIKVYVAYLRLPEETLYVILHMFRVACLKNFVFCLCPLSRKMYLWMFGWTLRSSKRGFFVVFYVFLLYLFGNFYTLVTLLGMGLITQQKVSYTGPYNATPVNFLFKSSLWITRFFYKQRFFFNSASVLLNFFMNWASNVV